MRGNSLYFGNYYPRAITRMLIYMSSGQHFQEFHEKYLSANLQIRAKLVQLRMPETAFNNIFLVNQGLVFIVRKLTKCGEIASPVFWGAVGKGEKKHPDPDAF